eukprot:10902818-Alexandrium_andersonii.AAC.1
MALGSVGAAVQVEAVVGQAGEELTTCLGGDSGGKANASKSFLSTSRRSVLVGIAKRLRARFPIKRQLQLKNLGGGVVSFSSQRAGGHQEVCGGAV